MYDDLEMWVLYGQGSSSRDVPLHNLVDVLDPTTVEALPAGHALAGCDTTSKISTKQAVLDVVDDYPNLLTNFAKQPLSEVMISNAETFLIHCYDPKTSVKQLRSIET